MTRPQNRLTAVQIKAAAPGKLQDGGGLVLDKRRSVMLRWAEFVTIVALAMTALRAKNNA